MTQTLLLLVVENEGEPGISKVFLWALHSRPRYFSVQTSHTVVSELSTCPSWVKPLCWAGFLMKEGATMWVTIVWETFLCLLTFPSVYQYPRAKSNSLTSSCYSCADSSPRFTLWSYISRQCCALAWWNGHALKSLSEELDEQLLHHDPRLCILSALLSHHSCG